MQTYSPTSFVNNKQIYTEVLKCFLLNLSVDNLFYNFTNLSIKELNHFKKSHSLMLKIIEHFKNSILRQMAFLLNMSTYG